MLRFLLIFISFPLFSTNIELPHDSSIFISPVKIPLVLSANFGELRSDHFHSGIDIKTQGAIGKEVVAPADGYVYRIGVQSGGYGNALYIRHSSGYSTVYGHLDRFTPEIEEYVTNQQYRQKSFQVNLFPPIGRFFFLQGDIIGYSGNSGGSTGPHLHFEVRDAATENPVDPLAFHFGVNDTRKPVFDRIVIYPIANDSRVNNKNIKRTYKIEGSDGQYYIHPENIITVHGETGFGIKAYDLLNGASNKCGLHSMELTIDGVTLYKYVIDEYSYAETKYVNSHIDYEMLKRNKIYVQQAFVSPNDKLSIYKDVVNNGIYTFDDDKRHDVEIVITDSNNNKSTLNFKVTSDSSKPEEIPDDNNKNVTMMPYNTSNVFRAPNLHISIPSGSLYDSLLFEYDVTSDDKYIFSDLHHLHDEYTPLHKAFTVKIKPTSIVEGKESKMVVAMMKDNNLQSALKTTFTPDGFFTASASSFGNYYIDIDTVAPKIVPVNSIKGVDMSGRREIKIRITDSFSGIQSYEATIDGNWALFEYDAKNNVIIYKFSKARINKSVTHNLQLKVTDNANNESFYEAGFFW